MKCLIESSRMFENKLLLKDGLPVTIEILYKYNEEIKNEPIKREKITVFLLDRSDDEFHKIIIELHRQLDQARNRLEELEQKLIICKCDQPEPLSSGGAGGKEDASPLEIFKRRELGK